MNRTYVEKLPDTDVIILPDQVLIISDKLEEEVTNESGDTYIRRSFVIVDTLTPEAYSIMQSSKTSRLEDAMIELTDIVLGGV